MINRPIGIDIFSGAGGMSLGFEQAGFDLKAAVEIDPVHAAVHKFNFPNCSVIPLSVEKLTGAYIRKVAGLGTKVIDCVFGGAPCQGFSLIGKRALDDPRNKLVMHFVRLVTELDANTFVFENVKGLTLGKHRAFLEELVKAFDDAGYFVQSPWKVLNATHYEVPQNRQRLFIIGTKKGLISPVYPTPIKRRIISCTDAADQIVCPSVADALGDIPNADLFSILSSTDAVRTEFNEASSDFAKEMRCSTDSAWHYGYKRHWDSNLLTSSATTKHSKITRRRFSSTQCGKIEPISRFYKLSADGVSNTLRAGTDGSRGAFTSPRPIHYEYDRCVTVREMARLHGFPDWFRFHSTKWHGARQIGNSVPPPLARAVAREILTSLRITPYCPDECLNLGEERLLHYSISQASDFFKVTAPISKRDRKSGIKKRSQEEIELQHLSSHQSNEYV